MDGIAIADAIENLTKEREKLSGDLAERAQTIQDLIDENALLHKRLQMKELGRSQQYFISSPKR